MAKKKKTKAPASTDKYDASKIDKLEGLEAVRKRPGMYIGDPDEHGLHHTVFEVLDNSIDEHLAGFCDNISVTIHVDGSVSIRDNGRGIPVDTHPKFKIPAVELVLTNLHAGGKFGQGAYKYSGGLHGVGAKCVNALAEWFKVEVYRDGQVHTMEFARGKTTRKLEVIGKSKSTGTLVTFKPDPQIFTITTEFKFNMLSTRLRELAFLNPGVEITLIDDREDDKSETFFYRDGIEQFVRQLGRNKQLVHAKPIVIANKTDDVFVDVVIQYNDSYNDQILCYANSIPNVDGGAHLTGFRTALTRTINQYAKKNNLLKEKDPNISGDDVREGLVAMLGPLIDTIIVCTMTALTILITKAHIDVETGKPFIEALAKEKDVALTAAAFGTLASWLPYLLCIAVCVFAYSTMISWSYYGERSAEFLVGERGILPYRVLFGGFVVLGPILTLETVIGFSDMMLFSMAFPNIIGLILLSGALTKKAKDYVARLKSGEISRTD